VESGEGEMEANDGAGNTSNPPIIYYTCIDASVEHHT
ncbi:MAG: hypothetical protein UY36_C0020G0009, partial [Parcubacteria group bacterium GW2011_GWA1_49_11]